MTSIGRDGGIRVDMGNLAHFTYRAALFSSSINMEIPSPSRFNVHDSRLALPLFTLHLKPPPRPVRLRFFNTSRTRMPNRLID